MKITAFDDIYGTLVFTGGTTLVSGSSGGSNSGYGGDLVGSAGYQSVVGMRNLVSLASNMGGSTVGDVLTLIQSSPRVATFATPSNSGASFGSNATRVSASSFVGAAATSAREDHRHDGIGTVTASSSNTLDRGTLNLRPGTNVAFGLTDSDGNGGFDTLTINATATGGGSVSAGSNSTRVSQTSAIGVQTLWSPADHRHDGIGTVTASSSNTLQRGTLNLRAGTGIALALSDSDGEGSFDTVTLVNTSPGTGGGGGGGGGPSNPRYPVQAIQDLANASTNSRVITLASTPTNGNVIFLVSCVEGTAAVNSITQTNVTWTQIAQTTAGSAPVIEMWKGVVSTSAGTGITVAYSATNYGSVAAMEMSGISGTLDQTATGSVDQYMPRITPTNAGALILFGIMQSSFGVYYGPFMGPWMIQMTNESAAYTGNRIGAYWGFAGTETVYGRATRTDPHTGTIHSLTISVT